MRILRAADHKRMPWKNGKGETVEVAVFPPGASIDDFDWRISIATVAENGAFSLFQHVDRTLTLLSGEGIVLSVEGAEDIELTPTSVPHAFPADLPSTARLIGGRVTDLNVMTNRQRHAHHVARAEFEGELTVQAEKALTFIVVVSPALEWANETFGYLDALILDTGETAYLRSRTAATILRTEIFDR